MKRTDIEQAPARIFKAACAEVEDGEGRARRAARPRGAGAPPDRAGPALPLPRGLPAERRQLRRRRFTAIAEAAGLPAQFTPHKLRHTAASLVIDGGADVDVVAEMLGHADTSMTLNTYRHLSQSALDRAAELMAEARRAAGVQIVTAASERAHRGA